MALAFSADATAAPQQRTIFRNGKVFTANPSAPWATAVAVQGQKILAVGSDTKVLQAANKPGTKIIDLHGATVVPGLNDAHVHVLSPAGVLINPQPQGVVPEPGPALTEVLADIQTATQSYPPGTWLVVLVGTAVIDDLNVNRFALDVVSPDHPVRLQSWTGHGTVLNTKGMDVLNISTTASDPFGGTYDRVEGSEVINGVMHEYAEYLTRRRMYDQMSNAELVGQYQAFAANALALGFTSVQDMAVGLPQSRTADVLGATSLPLRLRSICFPLTPDEPCEALDGHADTDMVTFSGIKWITDGTPIERWAYTREPYQDRPNWDGVFNLPGNALHRVLNRAKHGPAKRHQILFHAVGDSAADDVLDGLDDTGGPCAWNDRRPRLEHGDMITPDNYDRLLDSGAIVVQNGTHLAIPGVLHQRLPAERLETIQPLRSLIDAGIPVALGTDGIGQVQSPWVDIALAVAHIDNPAEAISVAEAISAYTRGSAYAEFQEEHKGTIAPGMVADLAVLSQDVFSIQNPFDIMPTYSLLTMVDGKIVWDVGAFGH